MSFAPVVRRRHRASLLIQAAACTALLGACALPGTGQQDGAASQGTAAVEQPPLTLVRPDIAGWKTLQENGASFELSGPSACHYVGTAFKMDADLPTDSDQAATLAYLDKQLERINQQAELKERGETQVKTAADGTEFMAVEFMNRPRLTAKSHGAIAARVDVDSRSMLVALAVCDALEFAPTEWKDFVGALRVEGGKAGEL